MQLEEIKIQLDDTLKKVKNEIEELKYSSKGKANEGKFVQIILSKLRKILGNPIENPIMKYADAELYYFNSEVALENMQEKYMLIIDLQDYIVEQANVAFIYDRYTIIKLLQITLNNYNEFISEIQNGINARNEDIGNLFLDIETMLLNDRNVSAENNTTNAKAIANTNRYKKENGGFGVVYESEKNAKPTTINVISISQEETDKKLQSYFPNLLNGEKKK